MSECLANIAKHAQASAAQVSVRVEDGVLVVEVRDDGVGGVDIDGGSGLQGLQDRVGALSGSVAVNSPPGVGTNVTARIPLDGVVAEPAPTAPWAPRLRTDEEAERNPSRRTRLLKIRLGVWLGIAALLIVLWALTGAPDSLWPKWPVIGIALVAGLDAWSTIARAPLRASQLPPGDPAAAARTARRARNLRWQAGALGIVNLALIGFWLSAGGGYFWPIWPLLGCAGVMGTKALQQRYLAAR